MLTKNNKKYKFTIELWHQFTEIIQELVSLLQLLQAYLVTHKSTYGCYKQSVMDEVDFYFIISHHATISEKRSAPSWLREKPYLRVRFTQDGITSKVTDSSKLKLEEKGCPLTGSLSNYSF